MEPLERQQPDEAVRQVPIIEPDRWPGAVRDAYDEAMRRGDRTTQGRIIARQTGQMVSFREATHQSRRGAYQVDVIEIRPRRTTASSKEQS
jgi:hypothetical protein